MSFVDIESKVDKKDGKKNKKVEHAPRASCSPRRISLLRQRKSLFEAKLKKRKVQALGSPRRRQPLLRRMTLPRRSKNLAEVKEESHVGKALGSPRRRKTTLILDTCLR